jgi:hypothetical protein
MYRGELLLVSPTGRDEVIRYSGATSTGSKSGNVIFTAGASIVSFTTSVTAEVGMYYPTKDRDTASASYSFTPNVYAPISVVNAASLTLEDIRTVAGRAGNIDTTVPIPFGFLYPCQSVYSKGTITAAAGVVTGTGTKWVSDGVPLSKAMMHAPAGSSSLQVNEFTVSSDAQGLGDIGSATPVPYDILARGVFRDVCVHEEALYFLGGDGFDNTVYIAPPGWNMAAPPGFTLPFDPIAEYTSTNKSDFLLDTVAVPSPLDSDPGVAILATDGPRLVLKKNSVYGLYGSQPNLDVRIIHSGDGCIDIRSAISGQEGAFWAGTDGIYRYRFGQFQDLTSGWMRNEWRALTNSGVDYCALGVDGKYLVVSIKTADAAQKKKTYLFDLELGRWVPELTNIYPRHIFNSNISGEIQQLLCVDDAYVGKIVNLRTALDNSGPARDEVGTGPSFKLVTGDGLVMGNGIDGESRILEVDVSANVQDAAGSTTLSAKVVHGGALRGDGAAKWDGATLWNGAAYWGPDNTKAAGNITSDNDATMKRTEFRVDRLGRRAGLVLEQTTTSATVGDVEIGEVVVRMRDTRKGT